MLLDELFSDLSGKGLESEENENISCFEVEQNHTGLESATAEDVTTMEKALERENSCPKSATAEDVTAVEKSLEGENSSLPKTNVIESETNCISSPQRELKLPLVSEMKLSESLESQKWDLDPSSSFGVTASIPFQWEEHPGKPKNPSVEKPDYPLRLPPIRQSGLCCHLDGPSMPRKVPNKISGKLKVFLTSRPSKPISVSKVSSGMTNSNREFSGYSNSDLESIWEEEDDEDEDDDEGEMVQLCRKANPTRAFQVAHSGRSYDSNFSEKYMLGISDFTDNSNRRFSAKSAEFASRRYHSYSPRIGSRSAELGLHASNPFPDSPSSTFRRRSMSRPPSNGDSPSALLANCLVSVIDMSNAVAVEDSTFSILPKKVPNNLSGKVEVVSKRRPLNPISVSKVSTGIINCKQEFSKDNANSDLESIWEEEDEEEMVELCRKTYPSQAFQSLHSRRSYDSNFSENYKWGISDFADNNSRRISTKSAEFAPRRYPYYSPLIGSRSAELGLHICYPFPDNPSSTFNKSSISRSPSNGDSAPALLANCLISAIDMSNAVPVKDSSFSNFKSDDDHISLKSSKMDCLDPNPCKCKPIPEHQTRVFSWASPGQKSLSRELRISHKYDQEFMRAHSMQPANSLNLPKRASSVVGTAWDSPVSDIEFGNSDKVRKTQIKASQSSVNDEEEYTDHKVIDDAWSPQTASRVSLDQGSGFSIPFQSKLSNSSYKHFSSLSLRGSSSSKDEASYSPCSIDATSAKNNWPNGRQRHFKDGLEETEPLLESIDTLKYKGCNKKHYKKRKGAKVQIFCVLLKNFVISCCYPNIIRHPHENGWCRRSSTQIIPDCIKVKQQHLGWR